MDNISFPELLNTSIPTPGPRLSKEPSFDIQNLLKPQDYSSPATKAGGDDLMSILKAPPKDHGLAPLTFKADELDRFQNSPYWNEFGFDPRRDSTGKAYNSNEALYGYRQTIANTLGNAVKGAGAIAASTFIEGWKDWGRIANAVFNWGSDKSFSERLTGTPEELDKLQKSQEDTFNKYPIFSTPQSEDTFWNRKTFGNMIQQTGFTLGTLAQTVTEEYLTAGIGSAIMDSVKGIGKAVRYADKAAVIEETAEKVKDLAKISDPLQDASAVNKAWEKFKSIGTEILPGAKTIAAIRGAGEGASTLDKVAIGLGSFKRGLSELNMANTEAVMEGAGTYGGTRDQLIQSYKDANGGNSPIGDDLDNINKIAYQAATANTIFNDGVLLASNRLEFDGIFKSFKGAAFGERLVGEEAEKSLEKGVRAVTGKIDGQEVTQYFKKGIKSLPKIGEAFGKKKAIAEAGKMLLNHASHFELAEGMQELLQNASNDYYTNMFYTQYNNQLLGEHKASKTLSQSLADNTFSMEGLKTFVMGAATGAILAPFSHIISHVREGANEKYNLSQMTPEQREEYKATKAAEGSDIQELNAVLRNPTQYFNPVIKNLNSAIANTTSLSDAVKSKSRFEFENLKDTQLATLAEKAYNLGAHKALSDRIRQWGTQFTKEEFEQAFNGVLTSKDGEVSSAVYNSQNKKAARDYTDKVADTLDNYFSTREFLNENLPQLNLEYYRGPNREDAVYYNIARNHIVDLLARNRFKAHQSYTRLRSIHERLSATPSFGQSLTSTLNTLGTQEGILSEAAMLREHIKIAEEGEPTPEQRSQLHYKKEQLAQLDKILNAHEDLSDEAQSRFFNASVNTAIKKYFISKNKEFGINAPITNLEVEKHLSDIQDYIKLNNQYRDQIEAFNFLANPTKFSKFHKKMVIGAKLAQFQFYVDAIDKSVDTPGFERSNRDLLAKYNSFRERVNNKEDLSEGENKEYHDLVDELGKRALQYKETGVHEYTSRWQSTLSDPLFSAANKELLDNIDQLKHKTDRTPEEESELNSLNNQLQDKVYAYWDDKDAEAKAEESKLEENQKQADGDKEAIDEPPTTEPPATDPLDDDLKPEISIDDMLAKLSQAKSEKEVSDILSALDNIDNLQDFPPDLLDELESARKAAIDRIKKENPIAQYRHGEILELEKDGKLSAYMIQKPGSPATVTPISQTGVLSNTNTQLTNVDARFRKAVYKDLDDFRAKKNIPEPKLPTIETPNWDKIEESQVEKFMKAKDNLQFIAPTLLRTTGNTQKNESDPANQTWINVLKHLNQLDPDKVKSNYRLAAVSALTINTQYKDHLQETTKDWLDKGGDPNQGFYFVLTDAKGNFLYWNTDGTPAEGKNGRLAYRVPFTKPVMETTKAKITSKERAEQVAMMDLIRSKLTQSPGQILLNINDVTPGVPVLTDEFVPLVMASKDPSQFKFTLSQANGFQVEFKGHTSPVVRPKVPGNYVDHIMDVLQHPDYLADYTPIGGNDKNGNPKLRDFTGTITTLKYVTQFIDADELTTEEEQNPPQGRYRISLQRKGNNIEAKISTTDSTSTFFINESTSKENLDLLRTAIADQKLNVPASKEYALAGEIKFLDIKKLPNKKSRRGLEGDYIVTFPLNKYLLSQGFKSAFTPEIKSSIAGANAYISFKAPSISAINAASEPKTWYSDANPDKEAALKEIYDRNGVDEEDEDPEYVSAEELDAMFGGVVSAKVFTPSTDTNLRKALELILSGTPEAKLPTGPKEAYAASTVEERAATMALVMSDKKSTPEATTESKPKTRSGLSLNISAPKVSIQSSDIEEDGFEDDLGCK